jgi:hypothetical protein
MNTNRNPSSTQRWFNYREIYGMIISSSLEVSRESIGHSFVTQDSRILR